MTRAGPLVGAVAAVTALVAGLLVVLHDPPPVGAAVPRAVSSPGSSRDGSTVRALSPRLVLPPAAARADYQLGGAYPPPAGVRIVSRDRTDRPAPAAYDICYVNAFQTQPQETGWWRRHHRDLLLHDARDREVGDPDWPGEVLLDTRTPATRAALATVVGGWTDGCARAGFAAVEPDNLDSWTRSHGLLTRAGNVAYARLLTARAHARHLAVAQKNTAELATQGRRIGFDFAVAEECQVYRECGAYTAAYGRHVIEVEYADQGRRAFQQACRARGGQVSVVYRDRDLGRPGDAGYVDATC